MTSSRLLTPRPGLPWAVAALCLLPAMPAAVQAGKPPPGDSPVLRVARYK